MKGDNNFPYVPREKTVSAVKPAGMTRGGKKIPYPGVFRPLCRTDI